MLVLAFLCDFDFPADDGTCGLITDEQACVDKVTPFDRDVPLCEYEDGECVWVEPEFDSKVFIVMTLMVLVLTAILEFYNNYLFDSILRAPMVTVVLPHSAKKLANAKPPPSAVDAGTSARWLQSMSESESRGESDDGDEGDGAIASASPEMYAEEQGAVEVNKSRSEKDMASSAKSQESNAARQWSTIRDMSPEKLKQAAMSVKDHLGNPAGADEEEMHRLNSLYEAAKKERELSVPRRMIGTLQSFGSSVYDALTEGSGGAFDGHLVSHPEQKHKLFDVALVLSDDQVSPPL
jgi:hypothetical protein